jgi:hypothetical protein
MKKISLIFLALAIVAMVAVGACGGNGDSEETTTTTTQSTQTSTETTSQEPTTTQSSGNGGGGFTWNDVPVYGGADQIQEFNMSFSPDEGEYSKFEWRYYEVNDSVDDIVDFYKDKMPDNGWDETMWMDMMEIAYGMYMKNNENDAAMVWIASEEGKTLLGLWRAAK